MKNKPVYVSRPGLPPIEEYIEMISPLWESRILTNNGAIHNRFERELEHFLGVDSITLFANGHMALSVALRALELDGEVITTPFTFASTIHAIAENGLTPVFCDISPVDFNIDTTKIESLITERTRAILPVHVYGFPCDVEKLKAIADKHGLKLIYDAAHVFNVRINGTQAASFGDIAMYSFHATKVFHSIEGGALVCNDKALKQKLNMLKNFGYANHEEVALTGTNAKMSEFHAAMGLLNLKYVNTEIEKRKQINDKYTECLCEIEGIYIPPKKDDIQYNYAYFPMLIDAEKAGIDRNGLFDILAERNIHARKYFYPLASDYKCYADKYDSNDTPTAKRVSESVLTLPMYGGLGEGANVVCEALRDCLVTYKNSL